MERDLRELQEQLGLTFRNRQLLEQAFTHSSYVNEHPQAGLQDNERLEFLGDAVLELTVSEYLFNTLHQLSEGQLTKRRAAIVCEPSLMEFATSLDFGDYVRLGKGEERTGGRQRPALLADVFEAFVGALYLDQGLAPVQAFLQRHVFPRLSGEGHQRVEDYKTRLQELVQHGGKGPLEYRLVGEKGPAHEKQFVVEVWLGQRKLGRGTGRSKKESEQMAASRALSTLQNPSSPEG